MNQMRIALGHPSGECHRRMSVEHEVMGVRVPVVVLICQVKQGRRDQAVRHHVKWP